jgi:hypothetical protein
MHSGRLHRSHARIARVAILLAAALTVAAAVTPAAWGAAWCAPALGVDVPETAPGRLVGENVDLGCPLRTASHRRDLDVTVVYWCAIPGMIRGQTEFKFKTMVRNHRSSPTDIGLGRWRLLVAPFDHSRWSAPIIGSATEGRPIYVRYHGSKVSAVPANANYAYDVEDGQASFATYWTAEALGAGRTYFDPDNRAGDLTFYVPGRSTEMRVVGLAYMAEGRRVVAVAPPHAWGRRIPANAF